MNFALLHISRKGASWRAFARVQGRRKFDWKSHILLYRAEIEDIVRKACLYECVLGVVLRKSRGAGGGKKEEVYEVEAEIENTRAVPVSDTRILSLFMLIR